MAENREVEHELGCTSLLAVMMVCATLLIIFDKGDVLAEMIRALGFGQ